MAAVRDVFVPTVGSATKALSVINESCGTMCESESACRRLHHRLVSAQSELETRDVVPARELERYTQTLKDSVEFMTRYSGKSLATRLVQHTKMMAQLYKLYSDIDAVIELLGLSRGEEWKTQWESNLQAQETAIRAIINSEDRVRHELRHARAQVEAMVQLQFQFDRRKRQHSEELLKLMRILYATIGKIFQAQAPVVPLWFIPLEEVEYDNDAFAGGSFGTVHHGVLGSGAKIVVKVLMLDETGMNAATMKAFMDEVQIWSSLHHPHVVKMFGASHVTVPPFIVCEDATNGNLVEFLATSKDNKSRMWELLYQTALGLEHLHFNHVVHGDLKLNNVLVGEDGKTRIADFGLSTVKASSRSTQSRLNGSSTPLATAAGGLRWRAPECFMKRPTFASDVFSFAMCIIEAATGEPPFSFLDDLSVIAMVRDGMLPAQPEELGNEEWALVQSMAKPVPSERLALSGVLSALKVLAHQEREARRREVVCSCGSQEDMVEGVCDECWRPRSQQQTNPVEEEETRAEKATSRATTKNSSPSPALLNARGEAPAASNVDTLQQLTEHTTTSTVVSVNTAAAVIRSLTGFSRTAALWEDIAINNTHAERAARGATRKVRVVEILDDLSQEIKDQIEGLNDSLRRGTLSEDESDELAPSIS